MYLLQNFLEMMRDQRRIDAFRAALTRTIRAGDVVLDLGAGAGVLSFLALEAGAGHVYAVEQLPVIEVARDVARANGLADRITFIQGDARTVTLPRKIDCLVGDVRGALPLVGDNVDLFEAVRQRLLAPGGRTVPVEDVLFAAPVSSQVPYRFVDGWSEGGQNVRYDAARKIAANNWYGAVIKPVELLARAQELASVHYDRDTPRRLGRRLSFVVEQDAVMTGVAVWFRAVVADGVAFDTSPDSPPTVHSQAFFPLDEARGLVKGDQLEVEMTVHRIPSDSIWTWTVAAKGSSHWHEKHSTFDGALFGLNTADLLAETRVPTLSPDGLVAAHLLRAVDGRTSVRALADRLVSDNPDRFPSAEDATAYVMKLVSRYCI